MSTPELTIVNNNFHPKLTLMQARRVTKICRGLQYSLSEMKRLKVDIGEINAQLKEGGVRLVELDIAMEYVHAYDYILQKTLELNGAPVPVLS